MSDVDKAPVSITKGNNDFGAFAKLIMGTDEMPIRDWCDLWDEYKSLVRLSRRAAYAKAFHDFFQERVQGRTVSTEEMSALLMEFENRNGEMPEK